MNRMYEELGLNAWPSLTTHQYDGWLLKYANGYTKRANSVYPLYTSTLDFDRKIAFCEKFYSDLGQQPIFKMNNSDSLRLLDMCLEDKGYHVLDPTDVMVLDLENYIVEEDDSYEVTDDYSDRWIDVYSQLVGINQEDEQSKLAYETLKCILKNIQQKCFFVSYKKDEEVVAVGYGALEREYMGVFNVIVKEPYRGKGYGKKIMNALLTEGKKFDAHESYLQVVCENQVAVKMYEGMGYKKLYTYWYRRK